MSLKAKLLTVDSIMTVKRTKQTYAQLEAFAGPQFPVVAMVGGLPKPKEHINSRIPGGVDLIISSLYVEYFVYAQGNVDPDTIVSSLADDLWTKLYADQTLGGLALSLTLAFADDPQYWSPYVAFKLTSTITYKHTIGGI